MYFWGLFCKEAEGAIRVRGGPYCRALAPWRKADPVQVEVALAWARSLGDEPDAAAAVAAAWGLAADEYDALLHLEDRCYSCAAKGHKAPKCGRPVPPGGGPAHARQAAHAAEAAAEAQAQADAKARAAQVRAEAAAKAAQARAEDRAAARERAEAKAARKTATNTAAVARKRAAKAERERARKRPYNAAREPLPRFKPLR